MLYCIFVSFRDEIKLLLLLDIAIKVRSLSSYIDVEDLQEENAGDPEGKVNL